MGPTYGMDGGMMQRLLDEKDAAGKARKEATDGECAVVTSVDLSI